MNNNFPPNPNEQPPNGQPPFGPPHMQGPNQPLVGLGGWLILFQVYMYWSLFIAVVSIPTYIAMLFLTANPNLIPPELTSMLSIYGNNLQSLSMYELFAATIRFILLILLIVLLYTRKKSFPRMAKTYLMINLVLVVITFFVISPTGGMVFSLIWSAVLTLLWNLYFSRSVRVANTFVR